jgi:serine/threonine protein kinase/WD40 repeat protein
MNGNRFTMKPDSQREAALFQAAAQLTSNARTAFLDNACHGDSALRARLEALLAAHEQTEGALAEPAVAAKGTMKIEPAGLPDETVGQRIGRYKILEKVGEGGCGVVYVAEQTEPVRRRVALKVIKLGMDTKQVVARFEAERQALAMMDHPNIAKVLDAGTTETGRPYFVMELVRGIKITEYCDQEKVPTRERLELFIHICHAIQHAHQKGIIHRDIKPSNILVTLHDGVPVPKVIDFGIAKATTDQRLTDKTVYTQLQQFIGTPAYMSPEQAEMSGLDVDTRSDIYSLGVLLYELLTGKTPFDANELMAQGIDEMRKTIREKDPVRPSTKLATLQGEELTTTVKRRSVDRSKLLHQLKGDLDWIVMKCLEKDRKRRYETANGLAMDLKRHLNNETVVARPPSKLYEFQRTVRRHKMGFAATAAVIVVLAVGVLASTWQAVRAIRAKQEAVAAQASEKVQREMAEANEKKAVAAQAEQARLRAQAEAETLAARRSSYNADMKQVQELLRVNNLEEAQTLLNRQKPSPGQTDMRGWEWRYLWSQTRPDDHEVFFAGISNRPIRSLCFSWDGRLLARRLASAERLTVTDLASRRTVFQPPNAFLPAFAHHDARMAYIFHHGSSNDLIVVVDTATLQPNLAPQKQSRFETSAKTNRSLAFTPDDRQLLAVSIRSTEIPTNEPPYELTAWDVDTGQKIWHRAVDLKDSAYRPAQAISPDGTAVAVQLSDGRVQVLETKDGAERFTTTNIIQNDLAVVFSPDSSTLLTAAGSSSIQLWDARNGQPGETLEGHSSFVNDLLFTPDGKRLISTSGDETIRIWDWSSRKTIGIVHCSLGIMGLALAPDGVTLASRNDGGSIFFWDLSKPPRHLGYQTLTHNLTPAVFTRDSKYILGDDESNGVALWDTHTLKETRRLWGATTNWSFFSRDARWILLEGGRGQPSQVWDVNSGLEVTNFPSPTNRVAYPHFTQNGQFLVFAYRPETNVVLEVWNTATWQRQSLSLDLKNLSGPRVPTALPNSYLIADGKQFHLFDLSRLNEAPKSFPQPSGVWVFDVSSDGRLAVGAGRGGMVRIWDMTTLKLVDSFRGFLLDATSVAFSPDGQRFAVGSTGVEGVKLWDTQTRQELLTLSGEGALETLWFSPDGRYLMAINHDQKVHLWSAPTLAEIDATEANDKTGTQ